MASSGAVKPSQKRFFGLASPGFASTVIPETRWKLKAFEFNFHWLIEISGAAVSHDVLSRTWH
jgi:hypothetical protein